ncbi:uncharacterized protein LOC129566546 [Sitodiplosis mosellana]|uniref:uncharacterized protein LOC129566546 n=1 Tax=Sitodiplosis mosellana TaxID=263140 RepID=UPI0024442F19|nr:uncharacterized protein LOC129566546 [Sitodiplosis mosellana]
MLWAKESNKKSALYVDIMKLSGRSVNITYNTLFANTKTMPKKSDRVSLTKRGRGNMLFGMRDWAQAMELYNECLCYAESGSTNISLAYANRSACFFKMNMYDECLTDIELATKAGYPAHLMPKLDNRKAECLKLIEAGAQKEIGPKLSFEADKQLPCMANVLKVVRDSNGDYSIVAKEDIDVGQTIAYEEAFSKYLYVRPGWKCNLCLERNTNLVPCNVCPSAMFCHKKCQENFLHEFECGKGISDDTHINGINMKEIRLLLQVIQMSEFSSADDLMNFVEETIASDPKKLPEHLTDAKSKYETYLKLKIGKTFVASEVWSAVVQRIYNFLLEIPKISAMFQSKKHRHFLMHLIGQHSKVSNSNAYNLNVPMRDGTSKPFYCQIGLMTRYFQYACNPNVVNFDYDGDMMFITARPVKKGEQLFLSYFWPLIPNKQERQKALWEQRELVCRCSFCEGTSASLAQQKRMKDDPDYRYIAYHYDTFASGSKESEQKVLDKCTAFLKRYAQVPWSNQIGKVVNAYKFTLATKVASSNVPWRCVEYEENSDFYV